TCIDSTNKRVQVVEAQVIALTEPAQNVDMHGGNLRDAEQVDHGPRSLGQVSRWQLHDFVRVLWQRLEALTGRLAKDGSQPVRFLGDEMEERALAPLQA